MNNSFYYFGIIYLLSEIIGLIRTLIETKPDEEGKELLKVMSKDIPKDITEVSLGNVNKLAHHIKDFGLKKIFTMTLSLFFLAWIIVGCLYADESRIFISIACTIAIFFSIPLVYAISTAFGSKKFLPDAIVDEGENIYESKCFNVLSMIEYVIIITAISFIIYKHFYS